MKENNVKNKYVNATKWSIITEILAKLVSPITNMILARMLVPKDFGILATVTMIMSFGDMFTDAGFQKYLVQKEFKNEYEKFKNANVAFWTNLGISVIIWVIIILLREQIAASVGMPNLGNVVAIAGVQLLLTSFSSIQMALYRRDFDFKTLFLARITAVCTPFIVTIPLALLGLSYWALIIGTLVRELFNAVILTISSKWKPHLFYKVKILKEMMSFSIWSLVEEISIWFTSWADIFIIGNCFNEHYLGLYKISTNVVNALMSLVVASTVSVLFSVLSRLKNDENEFRHIFFRTQKLVSIFVFPLGIGIYTYSDLATNLFLGRQWSEASGIIGIYALTNSMIIVFGYYCSEVYRAKGRPKLSFLAQILHLIILIPTCLISSKYGFWIFIYARSWITMQFVLVHLIIMKMKIQVSIMKTIKNIFPTLISAFTMGALGYYLKQIDSGLLWSIISIIICSLFYLGGLYLFPSMRQEINPMIKKVGVRLLANKYTTT